MFCFLIRIASVRHWRKLCQSCPTMGAMISPTMGAMISRRWSKGYFNSEHSSNLLFKFLLSPQMNIGKNWSDQISFFISRPFVLPRTMVIPTIVAFYLGQFTILKYIFFDPALGKYYLAEFGFMTRTTMLHPARWITSISWDECATSSRHVMGSNHDIIMTQQSG